MLYNLSDNIKRDIEKKLTAGFSATYQYPIVLMQGNSQASMSAYFP